MLAHRQCARLRPMTCIMRRIIVRECPAGGAERETPMKFGTGLRPLVQSFPGAMHPWCRSRPGQPCRLRCAHAPPHTRTRPHSQPLANTHGPLIRRRPWAPNSSSQGSPARPAAIGRVACRRGPRGSETGFGYHGTAEDRPQFRVHPHHDSRSSPVIQPESRPTR